MRQENALQESVLEQPALEQTNLKPSAFTSHLKQIPHDTRKWVKFFIYFLLFMAAFTLLSRGADGVTIARVTTVYPSQATISDKVKLSGTITAADKISVPALYGFPVKEIIGNIGGNIEAGETILQFEIEPLQEAIQLKKAELLKLQAELQAESVSQEGTDELERQIEENQLDAMQEEYAYLRSRTDREIENAQYAYDEANRAYTRAMIDYRNSSSSTDLVTALMRLDRAETQLADAQEEFDNAQRIYEDISRNGTAQEKQAFRQTLSDAKKRLSAADKKYQSALSHYEEVLEESGDEEYGGGSRQDYENIRSLRNRTYEARKRLEEVQESQQEQLEAAARNMDEKEINNEISEIQRENQQQEKYRTDIRSSAEQQMILLDIKKKLEEIAELASCLEQEGKLAAPEAGALLKVDLDREQNITGKEAIQIATAKKGYYVPLFLTEKQAVDVTNTSKVTIEIDGKKEDGKIESLATYPDQDGKIALSVKLPETNYPDGKSVSATIEKSQGQYRSCIPLGALRSDSEGDFVYIIEESQTIMGIERVLRRVPVEVRRKDEKMAAIEGAIGSDSQILMNSNKIVEDGDRVRLENES